MSKFKELFPLQVIINLDSRPDRLEESKNTLYPLFDISPIRKPGEIFKEAPGPWWNGAVGCLLSHFNVLQAAALLKTNVFIFEDDAEPIMSSNPVETLECACEELENIEWDMLYIGANILRPFYQETEHLAKLTHGQSTIAYGVNKRFITKLLSYIDLQNVNRPIDVIYADSVIPYNNCYITVPMIITQRESYSDIEQMKVEYTKYLEPRYWANLVRGKVR